MIQRGHPHSLGLIKMVRPHLTFSTFGSVLAFPRAIQISISSDYFRRALSCLPKQITRQLSKHVFVFAPTQISVKRIAFLKPETPFSAFHTQIITF
jgi:hypothetical protein